MEKAVGALRVLQTFWSSNESEQQHGHRGSVQASPTLQVSPVTETPTRHPWHGEVKLEEGEDEGSLSSENHWAQPPESQEHNASSTGELPNPIGQNVDTTAQRASTSRDSPKGSSMEDAGPGNPGRPDVPFTNLGFGMPPEAEAGHATSPSVQTSTRDSTEATQDSVIIATGNSSQPSAGFSGERPGNQRKGYVPPRVEKSVYSDEEVYNQPDIIFADGTLTMPLDGPQLREIIHRVEQDRLLCFKMRWYVARHVRRQYQTDLTPSTQLYRRRVLVKHNFVRKHDRAKQLVSLRENPFNRLDFEATRLQEGFRRNEPGWQVRGVTQILQKAYEQYGWEEVVTEENVNEVLVLQASADLRIFAAAGRMSRAYHGSPLSVPAQDVSRAIEAGTPLNASSRSAVRGATTTPVQSKPEELIVRRASQNPVPNTPLLRNAGAGAGAGEVAVAPAAPALKPDDEISQLRAEISELRAEVERGRRFRESYAEEQRASQEALMAEMRMMLEAAECGRNQKRKRESGGGSRSSDHKKQLLKSSRRKSRKLRKYVRKLKELDVHTEESLSSSSSSLAEDSPSDSD
ncbi:hypothetical protein SLS62_006639 [Diatrype stigma]|uniref:Uncharacterized protein n=1 Tax=Diatrype stigma TaxID=117547 RepID=A0AAN9YMN4_9PEZI